MSFSESEEPVRSRDSNPNIDAFTLPDPFAVAPTPKVASASGTGVFERYQKLLAQTEGVRDHESAILAAVDSAILGAPASSASPIAALAAISASESLPPARPPLLSFHPDRDIDWNDDGAKTAQLADAERASIAPTAEPSESPPPQVVDTEPQVVDTEPQVESKAEQAPSRPRQPKGDSPGWSAFLGGLACALAVGFGLGFVAGHGRARAPEDRPQSASSNIREARINAAIADSPTPESAPSTNGAEPLLPGPELTNERDPQLATTAAPQSANTSPIETGSEGAALAGATTASPKLPNMEFDSKSALAALGKAAGKAGICVPAGEPGGSLVATVTFAPTGRASSASISAARFSGSYSSECIRNILAEVKVRPFLGKAVTVRKTLTID